MDIGQPLVKMDIQIMMGVVILVHAITKKTMKMIPMTI